MTKLPELHPYYYPTTVLMVDDNIDTLTNLTLQLRDDLAYRLFSSPFEALRYINQENRVSPLGRRCFSEYADDENWNGRQRLIRFDIGKITSEIHNAERFGEVAVMMVDYDMPSINGLELLKAVQESNIKKILFTGVADETVAVKAFNEGIIDRFILKQDPDVHLQIDRGISELQQEYFAETAEPLKRSLALAPMRFMSEPSFMRYFDELRAKERFVEYYLADDPPGFVLAGEDGVPARLIVLSDENLRLHGEIAAEQGAPKELLAAFADGNFLPYFPTTEDGFYRPDCVDWQNCLHVSTQFTGEQYYHAALIRQDVRLPSSDPVTGYEQFLEKLDAAEQQD